MATSMLGLLGVSLFILGTNASPNVPDLDVKKLAGRWYLLGTAFGAGWIENPIWAEMVSKHLVMPAANGDLQVDSLLMTKNSPKTVVCTRMSNLLKRTKTPGIFFSSLNNQTLIEVSFLDVMYGEYFITQHKKTTNENVTFSIRLFSRKPEVSLKVKNKLNQVALKQNLTPVKIIFLPYQGEELNLTLDPYRNHHYGCTHMNYTQPSVQGFSFCSLQQEFKSVN